MGANQHNQNALKTGSEGAYRCLRAGESFIGYMQDRYMSTLADIANGSTEAECQALGLDGRDLIELARYETVSSLIWDAMNLAASEGNLERFLTLAITRFNPIANGAEKRRAALRELRRRGDNPLDYEKMLQEQSR